MSIKHLSNEELLELQKELTNELKIRSIVVILNELEKLTQNTNLIYFSIDCSGIRESIVEDEQEPELFKDDFKEMLQSLDLFQAKDYKYIEMYELEDDGINSVEEIEGEEVSKENFDLIKTYLSGLINQLN